MADIEVSRNGPYGVHRLELVRMSLDPEASAPEQGWAVTASIDTSGAADDSGTYWLCRCGHSDNKPFCDGHHRTVDFDGTETAATATHREQARVLEGNGVVVRDARKLCEHAGFCTAGDSNVWEMVTSADPEVLATMKTMVDHCPSGRLTRAEDARAGSDSEPMLPLRVAVVDDGPYLVTGGASIARSDGQPCESRNRMTLCRCGESANKPFCDGTHATVGFRDR